MNELLQTEGRTDSQTYRCLQ